MEHDNISEADELRRHISTFQETVVRSNDNNDSRVETCETEPPKVRANFNIGPSDTGDVRMWAVNGGNYFPCERTVPALPPGQYSIGRCEARGIYFIKKNVCLDELIILPDSASAEILAGIEHFWTQEKTFRKFGFLWKRGVLLWGPAGSGKTSLVQLLSKKIVELGGFSVYVDHPEIDAKGLELLRRIEPTRPIVVMLEDIDAIVRRFNEATVLALFDGELQIDNVTYVATTNYPGRLDPRMINRPSRFDVVKKIGMPSDSSRRIYLQHKHPTLPQKTLDVWVNQTQGFSFAHLKEVIVAVECLGQKFDDVIERLTEMMKLDHLPEYGEDYKSKSKFAGFSGAASSGCQQ